MKWISVKEEEPLCAPYVRQYLLCDINDNVYMGYRDDHDMKYYLADSNLTELPEITHFMKVPQPPFREGGITNDAWVSLALRAHS